MVMPTWRAGWVTHGWLRASSQKAIQPAAGIGAVTLLPPAAVVGAAVVAAAVAPDTGGIVLGCTVGLLQWKG